MIINQETLAALKAQHGERVFLLGAGEGAERVECAVRKLTKEEWDSHIVPELEGKDPDIQEYALQLVRLAPAAEDLERILDCFPANADVWGAQVLALAGHGAEPKVSIDAATAIATITVDIAGKRVQVKARKPSRGEWKEARRVIVEKSPRVAAASIFASCAQLSDGEREALASEYPALPQVLGMAIMGLAGSATVDAVKGLSV